MARPKMKLKPADAVSLIFDMAVKLEDYEFRDKHLVKDSDQGIDRHTEAKYALRPLQELARTSSNTKLPVTFPDEGCELLKDWLSKYLTDEGWTRLQASRRQQAAKRRKKISYDNMEIAVAMPSMAGYYLSKMAKTVGLDRKLFIDKLVTYLQLEPEGEAALKCFKIKLLDEQRKQCRALLVEAFNVTPGHCDHVIKQIIVDGLVPHDQVMQAAQKLGEVKLGKLAALAKKIAPASSLQFAIIPRAQLDNRSLLTAFSEGESLNTLKNQCFGSA